MAFTLVQTGTKASGTGTVTATLPAASTAGRLLIARLYSANGNSAFTAPAGWQQAAAIGSTASRTEIWYYPGNPGGITSAAFSDGPNNVRGYLQEFSTAAGTTQALDGAAGTSFGGAATSFPVTKGSANAAGSLGIAAFEAAYNATPANSWGAAPAGWTADPAQTGILNCFWGAYDTTLSAGSSLGVTASCTPSTNMTGWTGAVAAFKEQPTSSLTVTTASLPGGEVGAAYSASLAASSGTPPYTWDIAAGALPPGVILT